MDTDYVAGPSANNTVAAIQADIIFGIAFLEIAERAFEAGDPTTAQRCLDSADQLSTDVLRQVCLLTEAEADTVEPAMTTFEQRLSRVTMLLGVFRD